MIKVGGEENVAGQMLRFLCLRDRIYQRGMIESRAADHFVSLVSTLNSCMDVNLGRGTRSFNAITHACFLVFLAGGPLSCIALDRHLPYVKRRLHCLRMHLSFGSETMERSSLSKPEVRAGDHTGSQTGQSPWESRKTETQKKPTTLLFLFCSAGLYRIPFQRCCDLGINTRLRCACCIIHALPGR